MTKEMKAVIDGLRRKGVSRAEIVRRTGLNKSTVYAWCRTHPVNKGDVCLNCGKPLTQIPGRKRRVYCSTECKDAWWKEHPTLRTKQVKYDHVCLYCGKPFTNGRKEASYCNRTCFALARMKVSGRG